MGKDINELLSKTFDDNKAKPAKKNKDINSILSKTFDIPDKNIVDGDIALTGGYGRGTSRYDNISEPTQLLQNLNQIRAERQGWLSEAGNAVLGGIAGGLLTGIETASYILDVPSHVDFVKTAMGRIQGNESDIETIDDNFIGSAMKDMKESLYQEYLPIYKKNPDKLIDFNDSAFYWETFRSVTESAVGFGLAGMGAGAAVKGLGRLAKYSAYMNRLNKGAETITQAAIRTGRGLEQGVAGRLSTAYLTNHGESKMMALELYENAQKNIIDEYVAEYQKNNNGESPSADTFKELQLDAKIAAGKEANAFMLTNKIFMATDYLALNRMFGKGTTAARNIQAKPASTKFGQYGQALKGNLSNAPKEAIEEAGQVAYQQEGEFQVRKKLREQGYNIAETELDSMSWVERMGEFITSEQALLEGAMGLISGPIQYTATQLPFENFSGQSKRYSHQQGVIESSKDYAEKNLFNIITNEAVAKDMEDKLPPDVSEEMIANLNQVAFKGLVNRNLAAGTAGTLEETMQEMKQENPEMSDGINKQITTLKKMEADYNAYTKKYSNPLQIMNFENNRELYQEQLKGMKKYQVATESKMNEIISIANDINNTNYTPLMVEELPSGDFNEDFEKVMKEYAPIINEYKLAKDNVKELNKLMLENERGEMQYKNRVNNELLNRFTGIIDNFNMATPDKIAEYKKIQKAVDGDIIKRDIGRIIDAEEKDLFKAQVEESVDKKGGAENAEDQAKRDRIEKELEKFDLDGAEATVRGQLNESFENFILDNDILTLEELNDKRVEQYEKNLSDEELFKFIAKEKNLESKYQEILDSVGGEAALDQAIDKAIEADQEKTQAERDRMAEAIDKSKQPTNVNNKVGAAINYDTVSTEEFFQNSAPHAKIDSNLNGVKLNFYSRNEEFKNFLNSNTNKQGLPVRFEVENDISNLTELQKKALAVYRSGKKLDITMVEQLPIKAIITNSEGKTYTTSLFSVRKGNKDKAAQLETQLRTDIINALNKGITPTTTINYQYSGAYTSDGVQKRLRSIKEINEAYEQNKDVDDVPLYYVNTDGRIKDITSDTIIRDFVHTRIKTKGENWAGTLVTHVTDSNGNKKPLKLNTTSLSDNERELITGLYTLVLQRSKENNYNKKINTISFIKDKLSDADYSYLMGKKENTTVGELLSFLIFEGAVTKDVNPLSELYIDKGRIKFGKYGPYTLEEFSRTNTREKFKSFLKTYKNRQVNFARLVEDKDYKKLMLNNVITTDVAVDDNGEVFQSQTEGSNNPENRYKTKAIYVKPELDSSTDIITEIEEKPIDKSEENVNLANEINEDQNEVTKDMKNYSEDKVVSSTQLSDELAEEEKVEEALSKAKNKKANSTPPKKKC